MVQKGILIYTTVDSEAIVFVNDSDSRLSRCQSSSSFSSDESDEHNLVNASESLLHPIRTYLFLCGLVWLALQFSRFYLMLSRPFIDSYWLASLSLLQLLPNSTATTSKLISFIQTIGESLYFEGQLDLYESISKETLRNALKYFLAKGVIISVVVKVR